ncbi:hypothetical protein HYDPIDRAFT_24484 [Hydnomerulius pinastri MD-312]|nr:hypothetical protein HYDPIDRAFT_24484 [Hydnomerulius pinastri MD-312]
MNPISNTARSWHIELEREWDVLGPFPIHAREQHFLSPAYPLDLSSPISTTTIYPTSLTPNAEASWSQITADEHGTILVSHPSVPWEQIRATEGWAGLQHLNVIRGWVSVYPPSVGEDGAGEMADEEEPLLRTDLLQGAFFTILPPPDSLERKTHVPEWHMGNVYAMERSPAQLVRLPVSPARNGGGTRYEVIICGAYEIRLFGDPNAYSSPHPILTINFSVSLDSPCVPVHAPTSTPDSAPTVLLPPISKSSGLPAPLQHVPSLSITPHVVDGTPFGSALGVGVRCLDFASPDSTAGEGIGWWTITSARFTDSTLLPSTSIKLLDDKPARFAPTQTRIVPLVLELGVGECLPAEIKELGVELVCESTVAPKMCFVLSASLPLTHASLWTPADHDVTIKATYFFAQSMVTEFLVKPPREAFGKASEAAVKDERNKKRRNRGNEPILALHGAGVEILTSSFWADSLLRQKYAWVVMPQGRSAWGLDWHGPSAADAFAAVPALSHILSNEGSGRWKEWSFDPDTRVVLMGHSNGGQGAWYAAMIPAAGYIKSQAYVPWHMSRFAHFADPSLRAVLESSLTPDDNDLFVGNLVGMPVLAIHGGADDNVPPWHTRELVGILKTWDPHADVTYHEDPGQPHWYFEVLFNKHVQAFLDRVYFSSSTPPSPHSPLTPSPVSFSSEDSESNVKSAPRKFTLTVAVPAESGSLNGWRIRALETPGLLSRLEVKTTPNGCISLRTTNVSVFSLDLKVWSSICGEWQTPGTTTAKLTIGDYSISLDTADDATIWFGKDFEMFGSLLKPKMKLVWKILASSKPQAPIPNPIPLQSFQRLQAILTTKGPLTLLVPTLTPSPELSAALRIAYALQLFHALDARITSVRDLPKGAAGTGISDGNLVVIGCAGEPLIHEWLERMESIFKYRDGAWHRGARAGFERPSSAILFTQPHPYNPKALSLFVQSTDPSGLERAVRLFPIRTGVLSPDWLILDGRADQIGAAAVQDTGVYGCEVNYDEDDHMAGGKWIEDQRMSWVD